MPTQKGGCPKVMYICKYFARLMKPYSVSLISLAQVLKEQEEKEKHTKKKKEIVKIPNMAGHLGNL